MKRSRKHKDEIKTLLARFADYQKAVRAGHVLEGADLTLAEVTQAAPYALHEIAEARRHLDAARYLIRDRAAELNPDPKVARESRAGVVSDVKALTKRNTRARSRVRKGKE